MGKVAWFDHWAYHRISRLWALVVSIALAGCNATPAPQAVVSAPLPPEPPTSSALVLATISPSPTPVPTTTQPPTQVPLATPTKIPQPTQIPTPTVLSFAERQQIFEEVWHTVKQHYLYADFHGLDWDAIYKEYAPRLYEQQSQEEFYGDLTEMVARLDDQHSRFLPPSAANAQDVTSSGYENTVGIGVVTQPRQDGAFIQMVFPDSPAARADLRPRDRIIAVNGQPYVASYGDLHGPAGTTLRLNVVRPGEKPRDVVLVRQEIQGRIAPTYRRFPQNIGYIVIPTLWVSDMDEQVSGALTELVAEGELRGLILDVRANGGGWSKVLSGILSHFVRGQVGVFFDQRHIRPLVIEPPAGPDLRNVPLVVLIDEGTASYAEVLAAVLQHERGAHLIGTPTAGNTETIYAYTLRDGSRLWLAQEGFRLQNGVNLEGVGAQPDTVVDIDWTHFSEEDDPQILEALRILGAGPK